MDHSKDIYRVETRKCVKSCLVFKMTITHPFIIDLRYAGVAFLAMFLLCRGLHG